mmetsp:Transcript_51004/g.134003  ORF Transcript_51004/g.134003 Transcript_51004/m.134003 type:complete len:171 (+) Transcript_51004:2-514(+)
MAKMQVAAALLAAFALTVATAAPVAEDSLDIQTALEEDDVCPTTGDEGARCALNALQLRVAKEAQAANSTEGEEEGNPCYTGLVNKIRAFSPSCFTHCPQMCAPLGQAINAYLRKGGAPAVKPVVCGHKSAFGCGFSGAGASSCLALAHKAASFGFRLPTSWGALNAQCR